MTVLGTRSTADRDRLIVEARRAGRLRKDVAAEWGLSRSAVTRITAAAGLVIARGGKPRIDRERVDRLLDRGMTQSAIAKRLGCHRTSIRTILRAMEAEAADVAVPPWAERAGYADTYRDHARRYGEEAAASHCRGLKHADGSRSAEHRP